MAESVKTMPLPEALSVTLSREELLLIASNSCCSVAAGSTSTSTAVPSLRMMLKSLPATARTPSPLFNKESGVVSSRPVRFTVTPSVVRTPLPPFRNASSVPPLRPVKPEVSMRLSEAPPVRRASSKPESWSTSPPLTVSVASVRVKSTSRCSTSTSTPGPPISLSFPALPVSVSLPDPPSSMSAKLLPISVSSPAAPERTTGPAKPEASIRLSPGPPVRTARSMPLRLFNATLPWVRTVALTLPPTRFTPFAVMSGWSRPPALLPRNAMIQGSFAKGCSTVTSSSPMLGSSASADLTVSALASAAIARVV